MTICYLGLGSNLGRREENLRTAVRLLTARGEIAAQKISALYITAPVGFTDQPDFLNIVMQAETTLSPAELLELCLTVESHLKRVRLCRWGPRTVDIDILLYGDIRMNTPELSIPHPRMAQRLFVLVPLAEIAPELTCLGEPIREHIARIHDQNIGVYKSW